MKIRPVGPELFHADRGTDEHARHDNANSSFFAILRERLTKCATNSVRATIIKRGKTKRHIDNVRKLYEQCSVIFGHVR